MKENIYRSVYCGNVDKSYVGKEIRLAGWVNSIRNLGGLLFITLRDETGIVQLISEEVDKYININRESTITITGLVQNRTEDMINPNMKTGEIEVLIKSLEVLGTCKNVLPFEISRSKESTEDTRLKYRYLDLRNKEVHNNILFRSQVIDFIRTTMKEMNFTEIQTPIITATSPEGARDFIVPSRKFKGKFYALPQAPQIFKQLLMVSGFNKYFQIAPCFRDEDPRADRAPGEFYQLDMEMAFATQEDVFEVIEGLYSAIFKKFANFEIEEFKKIKYADAIRDYCSDKPDLRNPLKVVDVTETFKNTEFSVFKNVTIKCIKATTNGKPRKWYDKLTEFLKSREAKGLAYFVVT